MKNWKLIALFIVGSLLISHTPKAHALAGEPVPGAEILIEQEPSDIPVQSGISDANGLFSYTLPEQAIPPKTIRAYVKIPKMIATMGHRLGNPVDLGIYHFVITTKINAKAVESKLIIDITKPQDLMSMDSIGGPFSQSLSNIEDNGKGKPIRVQVQVVLEKKVEVSPITGEPVPGAEILIEQDQDIDRAMAPGSSHSLPDVIGKCFVDLKRATIKMQESNACERSNTSIPVCQMSMNSDGSFDVYYRCNGLCPVMPGIDGSTNLPFDGKRFTGIASMPEAWAIIAKLESNNECARDASTSNKSCKKFVKKLRNQTLDLLDLLMDYRLTTQMSPSVNNYGINDDGIK